MFLLPAGALASREKADILAATGDTKLVQADLILRRAADWWDANPDAWMVTGHLAFKKMTQGIPGLRSLIAVNEDGQLAFDSYNPTLFNVSLGDREYVKRALAVEDERISVVPVVVGRNSGQPFLPIAIKARTSRVIMASFVTDFLFPDIQLCNFCGMLAVYDGKIITSKPDLRPPENFAEIILGLTSEYGGKTLDAGNQRVTTHWRRSKILAGMIFIYYDASPSLE